MPLGVSRPAAGAGAAASAMEVPSLRSPLHCSSSRDGWSHRLLVRKGLRGNRRHPCGLGMLVRASSSAPALVDAALPRLERRCLRSIPFASGDTWESARLSLQGGPLTEPLLNPSDACAASSPESLTVSKLGCACAKGVSAGALASVTAGCWAVALGSDFEGLAMPSSDWGRVAMLLRDCCCRRPLSWRGRESGSAGGFASSPSSSATGARGTPLPSPLSTMRTGP
mmetsp:Transcript_353/g.1002  ORF Transcript_353/g.1002 Transcript_353/m.1002 type:complete len:226 (-) Transcript_353:2165-2842(-)